MSTLPNTVVIAKKALAEGDLQGAFGAVRAYLMAHELKLHSIHQLAGLLKEIADHGQAKEQITVQRLAILSGNHAADFIVQGIVCALAKEGIAVKVFAGDYNVFNQDIINPGSGLYTFCPEMILIATTWHDVALPSIPLLGEDARDTLVEEQANHFNELWTLIGTRLNVPVIQHLFDKPPYSLLGKAERLLEGGAHSFIDSLNARLIALAPSFLFWLDLDALSAHVGRAVWNSARDYHSAKLPFSLKHINEYTQWFAAVHRSASAKAKKCLVLDLDNTLWGGVIGDDGVDGIHFGSGSPRGEAHLSFCHYIKALKERGVILAINSKNDPDLARAVFTERADMPLKLEDFAAFVCNWDDKPGNMRLIAETLNLGLDALVFVDDNPAECSFVRQNVSEVTVVDLPTDASQFIDHLDGLRLFDSQLVSGTDKYRAVSYQALQRAQADQKDAASLDDFLASLNMTAHVEPFAPKHTERLAQMQARTNQFNVTTRRYHADHILKISTSDTVHGLTVSMRDRYADHGVVASLLAIEEGGALRIDDWLMSCRVFSRTLEQFMFNHVLVLARTCGVKKILGEFKPTERNSPVKDLYPQLGFVPDGADGRWWTFAVPTEGGEQKTYIGNPERS